MELRNTRPADAYCVISSHSQAVQEFAEIGYHGKVTLGITQLIATEIPKFYIGPKIVPELRLIQWVCHDLQLGDAVMTVFAHEEDYSWYNKQVTVLFEVPPGCLFVHDDEVYYYDHVQVTIEDVTLENFEIKEFEMIGDEETAKLFARLYNHEPISATLEKCTIINNGIQNTEFQQCETYTIPIWKVRCVNASKIFAAFTDDYPLFNFYDFNTLNWVPVNVGKGFVRQKKYYTLADSPDRGYYFHEGMSH